MLVASTTVVRPQPVVAAGGGVNGIEKARADLLRCFRAGVARVEGAAVVAGYLRRHPPEGDWALVAVGKAAQSMALGAAGVLGARLHGGLVISKPGHLDRAWLEAAGLQGIEGGHPLPDAGSLEAGRRLLQFLTGLPQDRPLLFLVSGGSSSLVEVLPEGLELAQLQAVNRWLLGSGLPIQGINRVRRRLSRIKGGGLWRFLGRRPVTALLISDVLGDDPAVIGSGLLQPPRGPEPGPQLPPWVEALLPEAGAPPVLPERPFVLEIVATLQDARAAAADEAVRLGYPVRVNRAPINAAAETAGRRLALELVDSRPGLQIWGGEPTVVLPEHPGRGGRNQHLALAAATVIEGRDDVCFLSAGTDGSDGPGEDAGAVVDGGTLGRARRRGLDAGTCLRRADSGTLLAASGDLIRTGPTGTNVMDLMLGLHLERGERA